MIDVFNSIRIDRKFNFTLHLLNFTNIFNFLIAPTPVADNGLDTKLFDLAKSVHWIVDDSSYMNEGSNNKRRLIPGAADDSDSETDAPPTNDIYRLRQMKRLK